MCRWMAWRGQPIPIEEPLFATQRLHEDDRVIVSEPFSDLPGVWREVPETTAVWCGPTALLDARPFVPQTAVRA